MALLLQLRQQRSIFVCRRNCAAATFFRSTAAPQQTQVRIFASFLNKNNQQQQQQQQQNTTTTSIPSISTTSNTNKELTTNDSKITKQQQHPTLLNSYLTLAKARLSALVVTTTAAGYLASGTFALTTFSACIVGTALCSASAAALNQLLEKDRDARMRRTQLRPLVTGALSKQQAAVAATAWGMAGAGILYVGTDPLTMSLGVANLALYAGVYTYMKPRSIYNTWVGAVVGAIPPVMGWTAATGGSYVDVEPMVLGATLYLWQMPHFFALSYCNRVDYQRGGFAMVPCLEEDGQETAKLIVRYAWYLSAVPIVATVAGATSSMFALEGFVLNAYALTVAHRFQRERTNQNARKVFLTSLWYLPSFLMLYLLHSKNWDDETNKDDAVAKFLSESICAIRERGRELCIHEAAVVKTQNAEDSCPVTVGAKKSREGIEAANESVDTVTVKKEATKGS
jgi:protoheme IX farnesyltransferase